MIPKMKIQVYLKSCIKGINTKHLTVGSEAKRKRLMKICLGVEHLDKLKKLLNGPNTNLCIPNKIQVELVLLFKIRLNQIV